MFGFGTSKKEKKPIIVKFEFMGFIDEAVEMFDDFLLNNLGYSDCYEVLLPGTMRFDYTDNSFTVHFRNDDDLDEAMNVAGLISASRAELYQPVIH